MTSYEDAERIDLICERARASLAAKDAEIARLKEDWQNDVQARNEQIRDLRTALLAAAEALNEAGWDFERCLLPIDQRDVFARTAHAARDAARKAAGEVGE